MRVTVRRTAREVGVLILLALTVAVGAAIWANAEPLTGRNAEVRHEIGGTLVLVGAVGCVLWLAHRTATGRLPVTGILCGAALVAAAMFVVAPWRMYERITFEANQLVPRLQTPWKPRSPAEGRPTLEYLPLWSAPWQPETDREFSTPPVELEGVVVVGHGMTETQWRLEWSRLALQLGVLALVAAALAAVPRPRPAPTPL